MTSGFTTPEKNSYVETIIIGNITRESLYSVTGEIAVVFILKSCKGFGLCAGGLLMATKTFLPEISVSLVAFMAFEALG